MSFVNERKEDGTWQTIDRERNIILKKVGGGRPQEPIEFNLNLDSENIRFYAFQSIKQLEHTYQIEWRVVEIIAPLCLKLDKPKLYLLIEEALNGYGFASSRENVETLSVTFAPNL